MSEAERHDKAVRQAIEIAARHPLPLSSRSLTAAENRKLQKKELGCLFDSGAMLLALAPVMLLLSGDWDFARRVGPWCLAAAPVVWAIGWLLKRRAGKGYVDPRIELEATDGGLIVFHGDETSLRHDYAALSLEVRPGAFERAEFLGIVLELPGGEALNLDNSHFTFGRTTGAAILARVQAAGGRVRPIED